MLSKLQGLADRAVELGRAFDSALVSGDDADAVVDAAMRLERVAGSIRARAAARAEKTSAWKRTGHRSAEEWLAKRALEPGRRLGRHEGTRQQLEEGKVSEDEAEIVTGAADENPNAEAELLGAAESESIQGFKERATRTKVAVSDEEQRALTSGYGTACTAEVAST